MKYFAIASLIMFLLVKGTTYFATLMSKKGYTTDLSRVLTVVLPIMSLFMYAACYYVMADLLVGFVLTVIIAWIILIVSMIVVRHLRISFIYIISDDSYANYSVARAIVRQLNAINSDIVYDDNIGMSKHIKIRYDTTIFSRDEMTALVDEHYASTTAEKKRYQVSLPATIVHLCELIFDLSFLINICMI